MKRAIIITILVLALLLLSTPLAVESTNILGGYSG
ncbi:hypothetical protein LCGC14_0385250 [marine sediment metagenome]|uniref:Uncharacterized protein n=1 Tax=marine sediment metagenome TaxID=412755 RepID=A0A0F9WA80_9ZZZZ